jgi:hypothetical protein
LIWELLRPKEWNPTNIQDQLCKRVLRQRKAHETLRAHDIKLKEQERATRERVKEMEKRQVVEPTRTCEEETNQK